MRPPSISLNPGPRIPMDAAVLFGCQMASAVSASRTLAATLVLVFDLISILISFATAIGPVKYRYPRFHSNVCYPTSTLPPSTNHTYMSSCCRSVREPFPPLRHLPSSGRPAEILIPLYYFLSSTAPGTSVLRPSSLVLE
jgi:hypothetical protein